MLVTTESLGKLQMQFSLCRVVLILIFNELHQCETAQRGHIRKEKDLTGVFLIDCVVQYCAVSCIIS